MLKLQIAFPYGLNDRLSHDVIKENTRGLTGSQFPA